MRRSAIAAESLLLTLAAEVPDTAATLRLSGMELADCIQEMGALRWAAQRWQAAGRQLLRCPLAHARRMAAGPPLPHG